MTSTLLKERRVSLLDLLDRILDKGVILDGEITVSLADVDLVYVGLKLLLTSIESAQRMRMVSMSSPGEIEVGE